MKRYVLASLGLIVAASYVGCLPADTGTTTGNGGSNGPGTAGTSGPGVAGTTGTAGDTGTPGTAGDTGTPGTAGDTGTPGTAGNGTAGNGTAGNGTAGNGTAGNGTAGNGTAGSGGSTARGGSGGSAGSGGSTARGGSGGSAGSGGSTARGGAGGTATAGTGGSTARGGAGGTSTGGSGNLMDVAATLDGQMMLGPCGRDTEGSVCATISSGACPDQTNSDVALRGVHTTDKMVTLGGTPGVTYTIVLHVQGEVESKNYSGGTDQNAATSQSSPNMDGWRVGGTPSTGNAYNVYMLRVTNPGSTTSTSYFLNSMDPPGIEDHTTYGMNYTTPSSGALAFTAQGGAMVRILAADSNCSMIKNCGPNRSGSTCLAPITLSNVEPTAISKNPTFNFNTVYNGQFIVVTVKSVTQN